jgi:hypothetical protein
MIAALPIHENGNCRNVRAELDGHGSAGAVLIWDVILRGWVDLRINHAGHDIPWRKRRQRRPSPDAKSHRPGHTKPLQHRPVPTIAAAAANARRGVDTADPDSRQHGYAVGKRRGHHQSVHHTRWNTYDARRHGDDPGRNIHGDAGRVDIRNARQRHCGHDRWPVWQSQSSASGSTGPTRPVPPNSQTSSGSSQTPATRTGKNSLNDTVADCMRLWDSATHMSKADWRRTCRRVQGRLDQVTKQVLER